MRRKEVKFGRIICILCMNEENDWHRNMEIDAVEGPVVCVCRVEMLQALVKTGITPGPSEVSIELIAASRGVRVRVISEICQKVLDGFGMYCIYCMNIVYIYICIVYIGVYCI